MIIIDILSSFAFILSVLPYRKVAEKKVLPMVSVVIATKNEENVIEKSLRALRKLDYPKFEIIVIDSSTDETAKIAEKYADKILVDKNGSGKSNALNTAIKHAKGEIIYILDADCIVEKNTLKKLVHSLDDRYEACIGLLIPQNKQNFVSRIGRLELAFLNNVNKFIYNTSKTAMIPGRNYVIYKKTLEDIGGFDNVLTEDVNLSWRLYKCGKKVDMTPAISKEQVPDRFSWYFRQQERWTTGSLNEMRSAVKHLTIFEKVFFLPMLAIIVGLPFVSFISLVLFLLTFHPAFLALFLMTFIVMLVSSAQYLEPYDIFISLVTTVVFGFLEVANFTDSCIKIITKNKMKWYKTPKEKNKK
ncbi:glycosyltransferase family 2 protein [archaeon]|nr:glycosyltransferase family 2 protein [archaeon]